MFIINNPKKLNKLKKNILILFLLTACFYKANSQDLEIPFIEYVSVNHTTGKPVLKWSVDDPSLLSGFIIKRKIYSCAGYSSNWHNIKIIENPYQTDFEDNSFICEALPDIRKEKYIMRAFKITAAGDTIKSSISKIHETIFLETEFNFCEKSNKLIWNNYYAWKDNFISYEIYVSDFVSGYTKIGNTSYDDTTFTHSNIDLNKNYKYYIKAIKNNYEESVSNISEIYTQDINRPEFLKADSLIVNNKVNFWFTIDSNSDTEKYILYKSSNIFGNYSPVEDKYNEAGIGKISFSEEYKGKRNYYYLSAVDYCGDEIIKSNTVSNIVLKAKKNNDIEKITFLEWLGEDNKEYIIHRCDNNYSDCSELNTVYGLNYSDNIREIFENQFNNKVTDGFFCYKIVNNENDFKNVSNYDCVTYEETVFIANAFNPKSKIEENRTFKPKIAFISDYEMTIYGSYGNIIFQTNNPDFGWDGTYGNGELAPVSAYLYFMSYTNSKGIKISKKGYVSLVY